MRGSLLRLPDGLTVVPTHPTAGGAWSCVVLYDPRGTYPPEGFSVEVTADDIRRSTLIDVPGEPSDTAEVGNGGVEREREDVGQQWSALAVPDEEGSVSLEVEDGPWTEVMASPTLTPLDEARLRAARDAGASAALREAAGYAEELGSPHRGLVSREVVARWLESFADRLDNGLEMHP